MTTYTIFATSFAAAYISSGPNTTYSTTRAGFGLSQPGGTTDFVGQLLSGSNYFAYQANARFDCSVIDAGETVSSAIINLYVTNDTSTTDFDLEGRQTSLGAGYDTGDWIAGASLSSLTLLGSFSTSGLSTGAYKSLSDVAMSGYADAKGASTDVVFCSSRLTAGTAPTTSEYIGFSNSSFTGTSQDPYLDVTAAAGGTAVPVFWHHYRRIKAA